MGDPIWIAIIKQGFFYPSPFMVYYLDQLWSHLWVKEMTSYNITEATSPLRAVAKKILPQADLKKTFSARHTQVLSTDFSEHLLAVVPTCDALFTDEIHVNNQASQGNPCKYAYHYQKFAPFKLTFYLKLHTIYNMLFCHCIFMQCSFVPFDLYKGSTCITCICFVLIAFGHIDGISDVRRLSQIWNEISNHNVSYECWYIIGFHCDQYGVNIEVEGLCRYECEWRSG